jgi:hypothetical protein
MAPPYLPFDDDIFDSLLSSFSCDSTLITHHCLGTFGQNSSLSSCGGRTKVAIRSANDSLGRFLIVDDWQSARSG